MASVLDLAHACAGTYGGGGEIDNWIPIERFGVASRDFFAVLYQHRQSNVYALAVRGTDGLTDWDDNAAIALGLIPNQFRDTQNAVSATRAILKGRGGRLFLTGHSLGGGLVSLTAFYRSDVIPVVTFNAPGMLRSLLSPRALFMVFGGLQTYWSQHQRTLHIRSASDIVSMVGPRLGGKVTTLPNPVCRQTGLRTSKPVASRAPWLIKDRILCAHRMAVMIQLLQSHPNFKEEIEWPGGALG